MNKSLLTIAALFVATLPYAAHAQGTIRGAQEGAAAGERAVDLSGRLSVELSVLQPVPSAASWASRSGRGFANTSYASTAPRSGMKVTYASARCCRQEA